MLDFRAHERSSVALEGVNQGALQVSLSEPLVDVDVIAEKLNVKRKRVYELARRPRDPLPSVKIGGSVRFVIRHVEEWLTDQVSA